MAFSIGAVFARAVNTFNVATSSVRDNVALQLLKSPSRWPIAFAPMAARHGLSLHVTNAGPIEIRKREQVVRIAARHRGYVADVLSAFDAFFAPVEPEIENGFAVVDYSVPRIHSLKPSGERFFFTSLAESTGTVALYAEMGRLAPGAVVIDGGAYCGASAVLMGRIVGPGGRIVAFEPDPENYAALVKNVELHGATNVTLSSKGLWTTSGFVEFQADGNMGSSIVEASGRAATNLHRIEVTSIADAMRDHQLDRLDFLKLDIEGAEVEVLDAARDVLRRYRPRVIIEAHSVGGTLTTGPLCAILDACGYNSHLLLEFPGATYHLVLGVPQ